MYARERFNLLAGSREGPVLCRARLSFLWLSVIITTVYSNHVSNDSMCVAGVWCVCVRVAVCALSLCTHAPRPTRDAAHTVTHLTRERDTGNLTWDGNELVLRAT